MMCQIFIIHFCSMQERQNILLRFYWQSERQYNPHLTKNFRKFQKFFSEVQTLSPLIISFYYFSFLNYWDLPPRATFLTPIETLQTIKTTYFCSAFKRLQRFENNTIHSYVKCWNKFMKHEACKYEEFKN